MLLYEERLEPRKPVRIRRGRATVTGRAARHLCATDHGGLGRPASGADPGARILGEVHAV